MNIPSIVSASQLSGSVSGNNLSLFGLFMQADILGKTIIIGLLCLSVVTWAVIFDKASRLKRLKDLADIFEERFWTATSLESLAARIKRPTDPMQALFLAGMKEWASIQHASSPHLHNVESRVDRVLQSTMGREMARVENWMTFLATAGSVAPFIGLFGTVWGIMHSFVNIAQMQNTSLAVVAPGIAEALLATAMGLVAAIPATTAYNRFSSQINVYAGRMENFSNDFVATLSRNIAHPQEGQQTTQPKMVEGGWQRP